MGKAICPEELAGPGKSHEMHGADLMKKLGDRRNAPRLPSVTEIGTVIRQSGLRICWLHWLTTAGKAKGSSSSRRRWLMLSPARLAMITGKSLRYWTISCKN